MKTWIDLVTGNEWAYDDEMVFVDFNAAIDYGPDQFGPNYRLPTAMEFFSLLDYAKYNPAWHDRCPADLATGVYWINQPYAKASSLAMWCVDVMDGHFYPASLTNRRYVICIKDII